MESHDCWDEEQHLAHSQDTGDEGVEQGDEELVLPSAPARIPCQEDEDFLAALDKMVNDNITESRSLLRDRNHLTNLTAPISTSKSKKTWEQLQEENSDDKEDEGKVQVMVMLRKGGTSGGQGSGGGSKITKGITVSADSQLGEQFLAREEKEAR